MKAYMYIFLAKKPKLAYETPASRQSHNILDCRGVIPVCAKKTSMLAHARECPYSDKHILAVINKKAPSGSSSNIENMAPQPFIPSLSVPGTAPVTPQSSFTFSFPWTSPVELSTPLLPSAQSSPTKRRKISSHAAAQRSAATRLICSASKPDQPCKCDCHNPWTPEQQSSFAQKATCFWVYNNIPFHTVNSAQTELFFGEFLPQAKLPDRRTLAGSELDNLAHIATSETRDRVKGKYATGQSDGWKNIAKTPLLASTMNVAGQVRLNSPLLVS